jgi:hypothetical protein
VTPGFRKRKKPLRLAAFVLNLVMNSGSQMRELLAIMLVFVNLLARTVLFPVELLLFGLGQMTIVGRHISLLLVLDVLFALFHARGLSRGHGSVLDAVRDAVLLILLAGVDFIDAGMTRIDLPGPAPDVLLSWIWAEATPTNMRTPPTARTKRDCVILLFMQN